MADFDANTGLPLDIGIHDLEDDGSAKKNDGFFEKGILQAMETEHNAGGNLREVKVIGNGHQHSKSLQLVGCFANINVCLVCSNGGLQENQRCLAMLRWRRVSLPKLFLDHHN